MAENASNNVAELLKQLEELKRKKAHKERKLKKIKNSSSKISKKDKTLDQSLTTSCTSFYSKIKVNRGGNNSDKPNVKIECNSYNSKDGETLHPVIFPNSTKLTNDDCDFLPKMPVSETIHVQYSSDAKTKAVPSSKTGAKVEKKAANANTPESVMKKQSKSNFNVDSKRSCFDKSKKLLDDSSNSNGSFFGSSGLLVPHKGNEAEIKPTSDSNCKPIVCPKQGTQLITSPLSLSPSPNKLEINDFNFFNFPKFSTPTDVNVCSEGAKNVINKSLERTETIACDKLCNLVGKMNPSPNEIENKVFNIFDYPKCSTSTDVIVFSDLTKNIINNSLERLETETPSYGIYIPDDKMKSPVSETIHPSEKDLKNKYDSAQLTCIVREKLSSILDAHYGSPTKESVFKCDNLNKVIDNNEHCNVKDSSKDTSRKRKLSSISSMSHFQQRDKVPDSYMNVVMENDTFDQNKKFVPDEESEVKINNGLCVPSNSKRHVNGKFVAKHVFNDIILHSDSFTDLQDIPAEVVSLSPTNRSPNKISSHVPETVHALIAKVCEGVSHQSSSSKLKEITDANLNDDMTFDSEILVIPETEGLGLKLSQDTDDFLETSTLLENFEQVKPNEDFLNMSLHSRLELPVVNHIVSAFKSPNNHSENDCTKDERLNQWDNQIRAELSTTSKHKRTVESKPSRSSTSYDSLVMDTSFLEEDTQELGKLKQVPYMSEENVQGDSTLDKSKLSFVCTLQGAANECVMDAEIILFNDVKFAFLQHETQIHVWRHEKAKWVKIFCHTIEDMLLFDKLCISRDADNLVIVMLLRNDQRCCLQFLLFEKGARVIKLMENTHWLEERHPTYPVLLCGLEGLMFATAKYNEVSLHAFIGLKENPRLMTAIIGSTNDTLCSLCKIDKLPNALMGINDSMLYIWHILEARLVTAVSLHPHDYLPIKNCFWATVEKGLIYFMTTCEGAKDFLVCQLLAANLATGFCQSAMTYSTLPSKTESRVLKIIKAVYMEPFLVIGHSHGAFLWSVTEEFCCAALSCPVTTVTISKDTENLGLVAVGGNSGCLHCYSLNQ